MVTIRRLDPATGSTTVVATPPLGSLGPLAARGTTLYMIGARRRAGSCSRAGVEHVGSARLPRRAAAVDLPEGLRWAPPAPRLRGESTPCSPSRRLRPGAARRGRLRRVGADHGLDRRQLRTPGRAAPPDRPRDR
jgi:hypothetical protein